MIQKVVFGTQHPDVVHVQFGTGDIIFTKVQMEDKTFGLTFAQSEPHKIGETTEKYTGKSVDKFEEEVKVLFTFSNPESITALIHSLIELQKAVFNGGFKNGVPVSITEPDSLKKEEKVLGGPLSGFTTQELTIGKGIAVVDRLPFEAPWLNTFGACIVKIFEVKREEDGSVMFGIGNEEPPIIAWVIADAFYKEWPK